MYFESKRFGECEIICHYKDVAIVELEKNIEKYVVTIGLSVENQNWRQGIYCKNIKEAAKLFNNIIEDFYMALFKI